MYCLVARILVDSSRLIVRLCQKLAVSRLKKLPARLTSLKHTYCRTHIESRGEKFTLTSSSAEFSYQIGCEWEPWCNWMSRVFDHSQRIFCVFLVSTNFLLWYQLNPFLLLLMCQWPQVFFLPPYPPLLTNCVQCTDYCTRYGYICSTA